MGGRVRLKNAMEGIRYITALHPPPKAAVVFDVDGTLLDNDQKLITGTAVLYWKAQSLGIKPFIVTARPYSERNMRYTIDTLKRHGITGFAGIYMYLDMSYNVFDFKEKCRQSIHNLGYNVILSVGDSACDIGRYGGAELLV